VKYFFLSDGWTYARIWQFGGLWDELVWRRKPHIECMNLGILEKSELLWLYQVEDAVLMVEVRPNDENIASSQPFSQVILKRLIDADEVIQRLIQAEKLLNATSDRQ
jgi:hypothetical protein